MSYKHISYLLGIMLMFFSLSMLPPMIINHIYQEPFLFDFIYSFLIILISGLILWGLGRNYHQEIQTSEGFLLVVLFWILICLYGSIPFALSLKGNLSTIEMIFETVSGLTTTGVTLFTQPQLLPKALLYYRQQLQFLGGMSIVVLTVAIMPLLGIGGTKLYRTETPGSFKDNKYTPRITSTAKALWTVYLLLVLFCFASFLLLGLDWFSALGETFGTVSTGGLTLHEDGFAHYHNPSLEWIAPLFMLSGSINFGLHFLAIKKRKLNHYWKEEEFRFFIKFIIMTIFLGSILYFLKNHQLNTREFRHIYFTIISLVTSSGSGCANYSEWSLPLMIILLSISIVGGCHGSTSGGIKMIRTLILAKFYQREIRLLLHPQAVSLIKYNQKPLTNDILLSLFAFISAFIFLLVISVFLLTLLGNDLLSSITMSVASLSNSGMGLGSVSNSYAEISPASKMIIIIAMLAGRLEIFSLFIIFSWQFWKN
jgi:trk system potassium uptake protein TrkH